MKGKRKILILELDVKKYFSKGQQKNRPDSSPPPFYVTGEWIYGQNQC